ncbi:SMK1 (YPR054W) [Zygosaccharomyces parabailii]|uniref:ZYBA0S04-08636g1_1 n=1 Tax=Zygosaccharomyces bailii (strain CLIB 213 / ATCC 58445 / CBS 680 / BCRC 21525 / NBRC 1098 / NCYC 1416 / NRRL Y-2227) TaxID=1333698 RepID=A0A8J2T6K6_ZYGB2|nr:SMK1 (YPR054W) [Zygosaccharomyces parabailii]CDF89620.1 ZYBA0S04-08636g1_1 [Zygosaccharomyces bailii CLIB 213]CDH13739.1 related to Sporulation-specific mitogen-activated protein kinase SMK1 [Zygosaccharomyces bailii ISA1307]
MDLPNALRNNKDLLDRQQKSKRKDWKYYRYKPSAERIKNLLTTQPEKSYFKEKEIAPRTIVESAKFSMPARYELLQVLGKGSYGTVCSVRDRKNPEAPYSIAVKKITNIFYREILLKRAIRELKFMSYFKGHKNIVSLINLEVVTKRPYDGVYCYQELIDYDLAKVIHSSVQLSEFHIKHFFYQILCGLKYIHSADVIHRDLKPGNILCSLNGCLKICDFGLARGMAAQYFTSRESHHDITNYVATRWYRAPELILSHKSYHKAIDMWSVGCILAEFFGRKPVFMGKDSVQQIHEITKILGSPSRELLVHYGSLKAWNMCGSGSIMYQKIPWGELYPFASTAALQLIDQLLQWEADKRLTIDEAINHSFLQEVRKPEDEPVCSQGPFDFSYEHQLSSMPKLREFLLSEVALFRQERAMCDPSTPEVLKNISMLEEP